MQLEINENPGEQKSSQVRSETSSKNKKVNYIEVVPMLPTYYMREYGILSRVNRYLFKTGYTYPEKIVIEDRWGNCTLVDNDFSDLDEFTTFLNHPDTIPCYPAEEFLNYCDMNVEKAFEEFTCWGISQVSLGRHLTKSVELTQIAVV